MDVIIRLPWLGEKSSSHLLKKYKKIKKELLSLKICPFCGYIGDPYFHGSSIDLSWVCPIKSLWDHIEEYERLVKEK